jgi:hypothetical protein
MAQLTSEYAAPKNIPKYSKKLSYCKTKKSVFRDLYQKIYFRDILAS